MATRSRLSAVPPVTKLFSSCATGSSIGRTIWTTICPSYEIDLATNHVRNRKTGRLLRPVMRNGALYAYSLAYSMRSIDTLRAIAVTPASDQKWFPLTGRPGYELSADYQVRNKNSKLLTPYINRCGTLVYTFTGTGFTIRALCRLAGIVPPDYKTRTDRRAPTVQYWIPSK